MFLNYILLLLPARDVHTAIYIHAERGKVEKLWNCSHACLNRGLDLFTAADSTSTSVNRSSTYANLGCLMRACASVHSRLAEAQRSEFTSEEKAYYEKSLEYYTTAQQVHIVCTWMQSLVCICYGYKVRKCVWHVSRSFVKLPHHISRMKWNPTDR